MWLLLNAERSGSPAEPQRWPGACAASGAPTLPAVRHPVHPVYRPPMAAVEQCIFIIHSFCRYEGITQKLSWTGSALRSFGGSGPYHQSRGERER